MDSHLETSRLILRPWRESDAESLYKYAKDPAIGPVAGWPPHTSVEDSQNVIRTIFSAPETYAVVLKQGLIPEAVRCLLQRCFEDLGMSAVWCGYYDGNTKSRRVMDKCGFRFHHTEEGKTSPLGDVRTEHFMRMTKEEWEVNQVRIQPVATDKKRHLPLLLLGDEQESMIDRYLERGEMFVMQNQAATPVAIAVVTDEGNGVLELKNLAVHPLFQRKGYGKRMIAHVCEHYKDRFHTLLAGTGESRQTLPFYKNCGFTYSHTVADFFVKNYDHPIVEEGKVLKDMIYFKRKI